MGLGDASLALLSLRANSRPASSVRGLGRPQAHEIGQVRYGLLDELGTKTAEFRVRD